MKIFYRVIGIDVIEMHHVGNLLFVLGVLGMILGSIRAMRQVDIRRMIAYSSVAQIGYIYMGIGIGTKTGMLAAIFHIISHAASKSMLFIAARGLSEVSDDSKLFEDLKERATAMWQPVWDLPLVRCQWSESRCLPDLHPKCILRWAPWKPVPRKCGLQ